MVVLVIISVPPLAWLGILCSNIRRCGDVVRRQDKTVEVETRRDETRQGKIRQDNTLEKTPKQKGRGLRAFFIWNHRQDKEQRQGSRDQTTNKTRSDLQDKTAQGKPKTITLPLAQSLYQGEMRERGDDVHVSLSLSLDHHLTFKLRSKKIKYKLKRSSSSFHLDRSGGFNV